jgi:hypothetical protein
MNVTYEGHEKGNGSGAGSSRRNRRLPLRPPSTIPMNNHKRAYGRRIDSSSGSPRAAAATFACR